MTTQRCEVFGCNAPATEHRTIRAVLTGYMCEGRFVPTREGDSDLQLCAEHATEADATGVGEFVGARCVGH